MNSDCTHDQATRVFKTGKAAIWAGSRTDLLERSGWALVISAVPVEGFKKSPLTAPDDVQALFPNTPGLFNWSPPPCLEIEWPDCGIPRLGADWWRALAAGLKGVEGDVGLCCLGGHGRTGTALAILATLSGKVKKADCPVAWVRKRYCEATVESEAQLNYIERVTGRTVVSEASSSWGVVGTAWATGSASANPTNPRQLPLPRPGTKSGSSGGGTAAEQLSAGDPTDSELTKLWFESDKDYVVVDGMRYTPIWGDDDTGELVGWTTTLDPGVAVVGIGHGTAPEVKGQKR